MIFYICTRIYKSIYPIYHSARVYGARASVLENILPQEVAIVQRVLAHAPFEGGVQASAVRVELKHNIIYYNVFTQIHTYIKTFRLQGKEM